MININSVFCLKGFNLSSDQVLREVINACGQQVHRNTTRVPPWNVDVVLHHLAGTPFEPLDQSSLRLLTQKTLFLVALVTAKRVEGLQALSAQIAFQGNDMVLSFLPDFVAKMEISTNPLLREFVLPSLSDAIVSGDSV